MTQKSHPLKAIDNKSIRLFHCLLNSSCSSYSSIYHWVVSHTEEAHHLNVCRHILLPFNLLAWESDTLRLATLTSHDILFGDAFVEFCGMTIYFKPKVYSSVCFYSSLSFFDKFLAILRRC